MQAVITSAYPLRGKQIQASFHYPQFSPEIEQVMSRELESLIARRVPFTLTLEIKQK